MSEKTKEEREAFCADMARAQAEEAMIFYSPTPEGYKLRAKNSYQKGFVDGCDYADQQTTHLSAEVARYKKALEAAKTFTMRVNKVDNDDFYALCEIQTIINNALNEKA